MVVLPVLICLVGGVACVIASGRIALQRGITLGSMTSLLASGMLLLREVLLWGPQAAHIGSWAAPFGIVLVADGLSALLVLAAGLMGLTCGVYSAGDIDRARQSYGYWPLLNFLLMGVCGAFLTGDIFNLFVWFEVMLIASFVLLALGGERPQMEGALKYVTINLVSSAIFLSALGLLYGTASTLNMADLHQQMPAVIAEQPALATAIAALLLVAFGIKAAIFPLYFWLPASYHTPPAAVSAVFAGLLTKVGVYALYRVFTLVFADLPLIYHVFLWVGMFTMVSGVLGAVSQFEIRRILSVHIISQIGYMILALALMLSPDPAIRVLGISAGIFYILHNIVVKTCLFFVGGLIRHLRGSYELSRLGGLSVARPAVAVLFLIPALSLAGVPPLSGFWAKLAVIRAALLAEFYVGAAVALFTGMLTLLSMIKIWNEAFWKAAPDDAPAVEPLRRRRIALLAGPAVVLMVLTVLIGLFPQVLYDWTNAAAHHVVHREGYLHAVSVQVPAATPAGPVALTGEWPGGLMEAPQ